MRRWGRHIDQAFIKQWCLTIQSATKPRGPADLAGVTDGTLYYPVLNDVLKAAEDRRRILDAPGASDAGDIDLPECVTLAADVCDAWRSCMHRQIDTGPVLVPDLSRRFTPTIAAFSLGTWSNSHRAFLEPAASTQRVLLCAGRIHRDDLHAPSRGRLHPRAADGAAAARRGDGAALQRAALAAGAELAVGRGVTVGRIEAQRAHLILCPPRRQPLGHPQLHQYRGVLRCMSRHLASNHV